MRPPIIARHSDWPRELAMHMPGWAQSPSGLIVPTEFLGSGPPEVLPPLSGVAFESRFGVVLRRYPSALDQIRVCVDETELGFTETRPARRRRWCERLDFEAALIAASKVMLHLDAFGWSQEAQATVAPLVFKRWEPYERAMALLRGGRLLFAEPHLVAMQHFILLYAGTGVTNWRFESAAQPMLFERMLVSTFGLTQSGIDVTADPDDASWLAFMTRNGAYGSRDFLDELTVQLYALFVELPEKMRDDPRYVPISDWFQEDYGLSAAEQFAAGIWVLAETHAQDDTVGVHARGVLDGDMLAKIAIHMNTQPARLANILTADRAWYQQQFLEMDPDGENAAWNRVPFDQRPLVQLPSGKLVLSSVRALQSWMTEGMFHRAIDSARRRGVEPRFRQFYAAMVERFVVELMREAHPGPRRLGVGTVHGEYQSRAGIHTPDVAIDFGPDLVLMEVVSKRLTIPTTVKGDPVAVQRDLRMMLVQKMDQLSRRITDLRSGDITIPGVEIESVDRIWPIIVVPGGILQNWHLWHFLLSETRGCFQQRGVKPPALMDITDVETLASQIESGKSLVKLLEMKLDGYADRDLVSYLLDDYRVRPARRFSGARRRLDEFWEQVYIAAGVDPEKARAAVHDDGAPQQQTAA